MNMRCAIVLVAVAGSAATVHAQQVSATVTHTLTWVNSITGDQTPLAPGQSAILRLTATMTPGVGSMVAVAPGVLPSNNTIGELRGIQMMFVDLVGSSNATGSWTNLQVDANWDLIGPGGHGTSTAGGVRLTNIQAGQFLPTWSMANSTNPVVAYWTGTWTPSSYSFSSPVTFTVANGSANPGPFASNVLVRDGTANVPVTLGSAANGFTTALIFIPAPSALALLAMGAVFSGRRRSSP
jgi:hypothetical protein